MVGRAGSAVLIFVSGMMDIVELIERFEQLKSDVVYKTLPIHGDIPFEEQLEAFKPAANGEVKVLHLPCSDALLNMMSTNRACA